MIKDTRRFRIWLLTFSLFAFCFQIFGFFTKAWLLLSNEKGAIDFGLWGVSNCHVIDTSDASLICEAESLEEVAKKIARKGNNAEGNMVKPLVFEPLQNCFLWLMKQKK